MSTKYTYDNYIVTVDFKNQFEMAITASDLFSGDIFINEHVLLQKIKKDTVVAALTRKNQKCLTCKFNLLDVEPRKLIIGFEVSFDFLPTFSQYISLEQIEKKGTGMNKVESAELRSDIEELQKLLNNVSCKESHFTAQSTHSFNQKGQILNKQLQKGSYLLEITGDFVCANGTKHELVFKIQLNELTFEVETCLHTNGGYGYLFSIRKQFVAINDGNLKISVTHKASQSFQLYHTIISLSPMIKIN